MTIITVGNYYAEWMPSGNAEKPGCGRLVSRSATQLTDRACWWCRTSSPTPAA